MEFNILTDALPYGVEIDGAEYAVNPNAETMLKISALVESGGSETENILKQLNLFYPVLPPDLGAAYKKLIEFYSFGDRSDAARPSKIRYSSMTDDAQLIYAAFKQTYNGADFKKLHWFEFKAMFENLGEDTLFVKAVGWRSMKIDRKLPNEAKNFYRKMKKLYALPDRRTEEQKEADFAAILWAMK